jgi:conjugative transfer signal peptidase TraF
MTNRPVALVTFVAVAAVIETMLGPKPAPRFVWNVSESVPTGLYQVQPMRHLLVTTLVVGYPPEPLATFLADGGYLPHGVPLIKRVLALSGQTVCRAGPTIAVDGVEMGAARECDSRGRVLPVWHGCRVIAGDEVFLMNRDEPASLDGRYFGPIPLNAIVGRAVPLWTFERTDHAVAMRAEKRLSVRPRTGPFPRAMASATAPRVLNNRLGPTAAQFSRPPDRHVAAQCQKTAISSPSSSPSRTQCSHD